MHQLGQKATMDAVQGFGVPLPLERDWSAASPARPLPVEKKPPVKKSPVKKKKAPVKKKKAPAKKKAPIKKKKKPAKKVRTENLPWN